MEDHGRAAVGAVGISGQDRRASQRRRWAVASLLVIGLLALASSAIGSKPFYYEFGSLGTKGGQFSQPRDIATNVSGVGPANPGDVYIADELNHRVQRFDKSGNFVSAWGADVDETPTAGTDYEICTIAAECKAGVASGGNGTLAGHGTFNAPQSVAVDNDTGNVYVSDRSSRRISEYDGEGNFIRSFGFDVDATTAGTGYEVCPATDVCKAGVGGAGVGQYGLGATAGAYGLAVSPADGNPATGTVYLANSGTGATANRRVETYKLDGSSPGNFGSSATFEATTPRKIAVDSRGIVYASNSKNGAEIERYDSLNANGGGVGFLTPITAVNSTPTGPLLQGAAASTSGLVVDPDSDSVGPETDVLYVLRDPESESANTVVQQLGPANQPGLTTAPAAVDDQHGGSTLGPNVVNGLGLNDASGDLYVSSSAGAFPGVHRVFVFIDPPGNPPVPTTGGTAAGANEFLLTLQGSVNPAEFKVSECHFEFGPTEAYGSTAPCTQDPASLGEGTVDAPVSGEIELEQLMPNTTYHYRLVAANVGQSGSGADRMFTTGPAASDESCPNAAIRNEQTFGAARLPNCMALELVSPPLKDAQFAVEPTISADGERVVFRSGASIDEAPIFGPGLDRYVASREPSGWAVAPTAPPGGSFVAGWQSYAPAKGFSPDLSSWFEIAATQSQFDKGVGGVYRGGLGGLFEPFSPLLVPNLLGKVNPLTVVRQSEFVGASVDHSHLYFTPGASGISPVPTSYLPGDPQATQVEAAADKNAYVAYLDANGEPSLQLLARDDVGKVWGGRCGARLGGIGPLDGSFAAKNGYRNQGSVSADGSRVYFSARPGQPSDAKCDPDAHKLRILERLEGTEGPWIGSLFTSECARVAPACEPIDGDDLYQGASLDQTKVYFTTNRQLASSDLDGTSEECSLSAAVPGCDLYLYDSTLPAGQRLVQVSAGEVTPSHPTIGSGAGVLNSIAAISADGSHVYFVAEGALTGANGEGKEPSGAAGARNLYLYERSEDHSGGRLAFIGTLDESDGNALWGGEGTFRNQAYPTPVLGPDGKGAGDGRILVFHSDAPLTGPGDDSDGSQTDVFRYDADTEQLERISRAAPGGSDGGAFDVQDAVTNSIARALGPAYAQEGRWASENGETILFKTAESLLPTDVNGVVDSYLSHKGQLFRLPSTDDGNGRLFDQPVVSLDGSQIAFQSFAHLLPVDVNPNKDVYIARVGGGFPPPPPPPPPCAGEACQGPPSQAPAGPNAASEQVVGASNVKPRPGCPKGKRRVVRKGKARCVKRTKRAQRKRPARTDRRAGK